MHHRNTSLYHGLSSLLITLAACAWQPSAASDISLRAWPEKAVTPPLDLTDRDGHTWNSADLRGKVVVLNFWASWCGPCVDELPLLNALTDSSAATEGKLVVIGINFKESATAIERFLAQHRFHFPVVVDRTGELFKQWTGGVMPTTVVIGKDGRARWRLVGELAPADPGFRKAVDQLLQAPAMKKAGAVGQSTSPVSANEAK